LNSSRSRQSTILLLALDCLGWKAETASFSTALSLLMTE
jgi:hypothetical protein